MHGRKKQFSPLTENEINAINEKSKLYTSLLEILIDKRKKQEYNEDNLLFTTKMIVIVLFIGTQLYVGMRIRLIRQPNNLVLIT